MCRIEVNSGNNNLTKLRTVIGLISLLFLAFVVAWPALAIYAAQPSDARGKHR